MQNVNSSNANDLLSLSIKRKQSNIVSKASNQLEGRIRSLCKVQTKQIKKKESPSRRSKGWSTDSNPKTKEEFVQIINTENSKRGTKSFPMSLQHQMFRNTNTLQIMCTLCIRSKHFKWSRVCRPRFVNPHRTMFHKKATGRRHHRYCYKGTMTRCHSVPQT